MVSGKIYNTYAAYDMPTRFKSIRFYMIISHTPNQPKEISNEITPKQYHGSIHEMYQSAEVMEVLFTE